MKSWSETILFAAPVRDVVPRGAAGTLSSSPLNAGREAHWQAQIEESYQRGRIDGERSLGEQLVQQRGELRELFDGTLQSLRNALPQVVRESEQAVVELAFEVARKIIQDLPVTTEMIESVVREAVREVEGGSEVKIRLNPADLELIQKNHSELLSPSDRGTRMTFHAAPEVTRGGCLVETNFGMLDARRESKLELVKQSLLP